MPKRTNGAVSLATMADAVRLASDRETMVMATLSEQDRRPRTGYAAALVRAANLLQELSKSALEGDRRTRGLRGRVALWLGVLASRLMQ